MCEVIFIVCICNALFCITDIVVCTYIISSHQTEDDQMRFGFAVWLQITYVCVMNIINLFRY